MAKTNEILEERGHTHGDFYVNAEISQDFKDIIIQCDDELTPVMKEALDMIVHKISRILAGNPFHQDHWDDIAGYAQLVSNSLRKNEND